MCRSKNILGTLCSSLRFKTISDFSRVKTSVQKLAQKVAHYEQR